MSEAPPAVAADVGAAAVAAVAEAAPVASATVNGNNHAAAPPANDDGKVMADSGVSATVTVSLHPLVIMNISEHWTRSSSKQRSVDFQFH